MAGGLARTTACWLVRPSAGAARMSLEGRKRASAEDSAFAAELIDRLAGYDANLLHLGILLIEECAARAALCFGMRRRADS